jgi:hypothetical protein
MKPEWKKAPKWAQWLAMDLDGEWWWFEEKPDYDRDCVWRSKGGRHEKASDNKPMLEPRP